MNTILRQKAVTLRHQGKTYPEIAAALHIPRSTLNYWLSKLTLSKMAQERILNRKRANLIQLRKKAVVVNRERHQAKKNEAILWSYNLLETVQINKEVKMLLLTMLYLGEGFKRKSLIGLGNSNEAILLMFVKLVREIFACDEKKFRCFLHLRADQDDQQEKGYWSKILSIPVTQFRKTQYDQRTLGKKTWIGYHGVCSVYYYDATVGKKLTALQDTLTDKILEGG